MIIKTLTAIIGVRGSDFKIVASDRSKLQKFYPWMRQSWKSTAYLIQQPRLF